MKNISRLFVSILILIVGFCGEQVNAQKVKKVDLAKKIADATPKELPQYPVEVRPSTDSKDESLTGKVKSVVDYSMEAGKRFVDAEQYFDASGNLIRSIDYQEGYPERVTVYGYVDGMRVSRTADVVYAQGEKPPPKGMYLTQNLDNDAPAIKRDDRYMARYIRKYDAENRLIEERRAGNNGVVWSWTKHTYSGKMRTTRIFDSNGQEISKSDYFQDDKGNDVKQNSYGMENSVDTNFMTYEFDPQGNWIVKKTFEEKKVKGKMVRKLLWSSYRTITYYQ